MIKIDVIDEKDISTNNYNVLDLACCAVLQFEVIDIVRAPASGWNGPGI